MAQHHRRNGAAEGSDGMDPAELRAETSLEIVGQEIAPLVSPGEFLSAAGAISQTQPARTELAASQSPLTRPMASDAGRSQANGMEGQLPIGSGKSSFEHWDCYPGIGAIGTNWTTS